MKLSQIMDLLFIKTVCNMFILGILKRSSILC